MNAPLPATINAGVPALQMDEKALLTVLENSLYPGASTVSIALVINYCRAAGLDPMMKPVHIVPMWDNKAGRMRDTIMPGIGLYRTQAARSGQYAGITEPEFGPDVTEKIGGAEITYPAWCKVTAKRSMPNGIVAEFSAIERWKENYAVKGGKEKSIAPNAMWMKRPYAQLAKCASAQALRIAFPEMTGAQPTADEMEGKTYDEGITIDHAKQEPEKKEATIPAYSDEQFKKNLPVWTKLIASGKKTAEQIIATVSSKAVLSEEQIQAIEKVKIEAPVVSFAQVADKINGAKDADELDAAADLIGEVADAEQRKDLGTLFEERKAEFNGGQ